MKKLLCMITAAVLFTVLGCAFAELTARDNYTAGEDIRDIVVTCWSEDSFDDGSGAVTADALRIQYVGAQAPQEVMSDADAAHSYALDTLSLGELTVYRPENESGIRFFYEGSGDMSNADTEFADYDSYYAGDIEGQIRRITYHPKDTNTIYIKFYFYESDIHNALRVRWLPETAQWQVTRFDSDVIENSYEAFICAKYSFLDECGGFEVSTQTGNLRVRETPGGKVIATLEKGQKLTVYRYQMIAKNTGKKDLENLPFTLVAKYSDPDEDGWRTFEYYGWCATEYLGQMDDYVWILNGQLSDGTETEEAE